MVGRRARRVWMLFQVVAIVALFAGALAALWRAGADAIARDRRRAEALRTLAQADDAMAVRGARGLAILPDWPDSLEPEEWPVLDAWLANEASKAISRFSSVGGGYYVPSADRYLGHAGSTRSEATATRPGGLRTASEPPSRLRDMVDDQVRVALDRDRPIDRIVDSPPEAIAVRAAPVRVNGRRVAATWALMRLGDDGSLGRSLRSYQWATGLALGGLALAIVLMGSLTATIRGHVAQRTRIEAELRHKERLASLGTLLAGVSHELRNPLAGIRSAAQLWEKGIVNDDELASELIGEVDRLDSIIGQLLMFSRAEPRSLASVDLNEVVGEAARLVRPLADAQSVAIQVEPAMGPPAVAIDPAAILQVLRNLTSNALQVMPRGGTLRISTGSDERRGMVWVSVEDTGPGLTREVQEHLFEPFFTTRDDGTGLGLAIAREIAMAHRGELTARNKAGGGSDFILFLPVGAESP